MRHDEHYCPSCKILMKRQYQRKTNAEQWYCPKCKKFKTKHGYGFTRITNDEEVIELRKELHKLAEKIWGKWNEIDKEKKRIMYKWFDKNTESKHIGLMGREELLETRFKIRLKVPTTKDIQTEKQNELKRKNKKKLLAQVAQEKKDRINAQDKIKIELLKLKNQVPRKSKKWWQFWKQS